jgi:Putative polyhydroxyalkanoic acid system protein (PHA_gran_rgn)
MATPTIVDIPHNLGREAAKARLRANIGSLGDYIPGGLAALDTNWPGPDQMVIALEAMGQRLTVTLDVADSNVRATFMLPGMLSFMADAITAAVRRQGSQLLLPGKD